jgi:tol-pal system protein YbgF
MKINSKLSVNQVFLLSLVVVVLMGCFMFSCGGSKKNAKMDENVDVDALLRDDGEAASPSTATTASTSGQTGDDSEVLQLLGITPAAQETANESELGELERDVESLREEVLRKDQEISGLRSELTQKEVQISDLEGRLTSKPAANPLPFSEFKSRYQSALSQYKSRNYEGAVATFTELLATGSNNSLTDNCQYWIGESYYGLQDYNQAIAEFEKVFSFPDSNKDDDAQLKLGLCYLKLGDKTQARAELERLISLYPGSEYRSIAERYLAQI